MLLGMSKLPKIISFLFCCNILGKKWVMKLIFCIQISMKVSYKLILWLFLWIVKHSQSSGDRKFVMSLQYLKRQVEMKLIFCIIIKVCWTLISTLWAYRVIKKKKLGKEVRYGLCFFCTQINIIAFTSWHCCFWWKWTCSDMPKVPNKL